MLLLFITYYAVTQSIKCLQQKRCETPHEPRGFWDDFFSERRNAERITGRRRQKTGGEIHMLSCGEVERQRSEGERGGVKAYLYSQNVSSFMPWDSTSGWRSSFSFTAHKSKRRDQWFPQETTACDDASVLTLWTTGTHFSQIFEKFVFRFPSKREALACFIVFMFYTVEMFILRWISVLMKVTHTDSQQNRRESCCKW